MTNQPTGLTIPATFKIANAEINKEKLQELIATDTKLVINGVADTASYKLAVTKRGEYRTLRTSLEKHRKDHVKPFQDYCTNYKKATDELGNLAYTGEEYFDEMIQAIDNEKARIKLEKEQAEQKRIHDRVVRLQALGMTYDEGTYLCEYEPALTITFENVKTFGDGDFNDFVADVTEAWESEQVRLTRLRLEAEQAEIDRLAEVENQRLLAIKNAQDAEILASRIKAIRIKELGLMGFKEDSGAWFYKGVIGINGSEFETSDEEWDGLMASTQAEIDKHESAPVIDLVPEDKFSHNLYGSTALVLPGEEDFVASQIAIGDTVGTQIDFSMLDAFEAFVEANFKPLQVGNIKKAINMFKLTF